MPDQVHVDLPLRESRRGERVGQQQEKRQRDAGQRGDEAGSDPAVAQRGFPLFVGTRQRIEKTYSTTTPPA